MIYDAHAHYRSPQSQIILSRDAFAVHPWDLQEDVKIEEFRAKWSNLIKNLDPVICIGECGIDRRKARIAPVSIQKEVFRLHLELAQKLKIPTIIHCVRAFSDVIEILKIVKPTQTLLFHDFNGNKEQVKALMKYSSYFSFGISLFRVNAAIKHKIKMIPKDRLLLETGDQSAKSIWEIYDRAADLLEIPFSELEKNLENNFSKFLNLNDISPSDFIENFHQAKRL